MKLTAARFVGKRSASVQLTAGRWFFITGPSTSRIYFAVVNGGAKTTT